MRNPSRSRARRAGDHVGARWVGTGGDRRTDEAVMG
jgi:hypothetical protein